jgi:hypothetical protein
MGQREAARAARPMDLLGAVAPSLGRFGAEGQWPRSQICQRSEREKLLEGHYLFCHADCWNSPQMAILITQGHQPSHLSRTQFNRDDLISQMVQSSMEYEMSLFCVIRKGSRNVSVLTWVNPFWAATARLPRADSAHKWLRSRLRAPRLARMQFSAFCVSGWPMELLLSIGRW